MLDAPGVPGFWRTTAANYHATHDVIGHSAIEEFRESPRAYAALRVHGTLAAPPWSLALRLGSALHALLLQPEYFRSHWAVRTVTPADRASGAFVVAPAELRAVVSWAKALRSGPATGPYLAARGAVLETPIVWRDEETGILCKSLPDLWIPGSPRVIVNVKTAGDARPHEFRHAVEEYGYHRGAAWYLDGDRAVHGAGDVVHLFAVVGKQTLETAVYELEPEDLEKARAQNRRALVRLAECRSTGDWSARFERAPIRLSLANHAFTEDDWEVL